MPLFLNTHVNKVDRKGRVSVPASFRAALATQSMTTIVAFPSFRAPAIEVVDRQRMEEFSASTDQYAQFSETHDDLSLAIFSGAEELAFDGEGRVMLPKSLADHAKITTSAAFVGLGRTFQIWSPETFERHKQSASERVREQGLSLMLRRSTEGGNT
ncbi:MAG: division/cell wall cluster transcriptional repressor MraZ [Alphaproteobacteria bacterium]